MKKLTTILLVSIAALLVTGNAARVLAQSKTVWDGTFSAAQATSGQAVYNQFCSNCHGQTGTGGASQGAPPLRGDKFMENWREDNLESFYTKIKTTMPRRDPKSLSEAETLNIVAYIMQMNEFPGGSDLSVDHLRGVQIQRKEGPKPLPNYAIIQIVGCMTQEGDSWSLTQVGPPTRIRSSEKSTPEELKAAESKPLGAQSFRLQNMTMLGAFSPEAHKGHKMMAKGPLIRQGSTERISVTELEMIGSACSP